MQPTDKFSLIVESQTRGEASINRLNDTLAKLSDVVAKTNERTARSTEAATKRTTDAFKRTESGAQNLGQNISRFLVAPLSSMSDAFLSGAAGIGKFAGAAAGIVVGIGGAAIGLKNFTQAASESAREIQSLSLATGLSINQSDKLRAASVLAGFDIRNLKEAALDLSQALRDTSGEGQRVRDLLRQLGVSAFKTSGESRELNEVLLDTFDALSKIENVSDRVNKSRVLGGEDAAKSVQPLLAQYAKLNKEAENLGFGSREALVNSVIEANAEMRKFDLQFEALKAKLGTGLTIALKFVNENFGGLTKAGKASAALLIPGVGPLGIPFIFGADDPAKIDPLKGFKPSISPVLATDLAEGQKLSAAFRTGLAGTETGITERLDKIGEERLLLQNKLANGKLGGVAYKQLEALLRTLEAEQIGLGFLLARIRSPQEVPEAIRGLQTSAFGQDEVIRLIGNQAATVEGLRRKGATPEELESASSTFTPDILQAIDARRSAKVNRGRLNDIRSGFATANPFLFHPDFARTAFIAFNEDIAAADVIPGFDPNATAGALQFEKERRDRSRALQFVSAELAHQERKVDLLTGPGGELAAVEKIADLRRAALQQELDLGAEIFDLNERRLQIEEDREIRIIELQRRKRDEARSLASGFVGSLQSGNVGGFLRNQGGQLLNQIGTNALAGPVNGLLTRFGSLGAASGFGGLLKGTVFDPQNAAIDRNIAALDRNTAAQYQTAGGGVAGGGLAIPGVPGVTFSDLYRGLKVFGSDTNGITGQGPLSASALGKFDRSISLGNGKATTLGALIGPAAAIGSAAFGAVNGFKSGGAQGNLTAAASIAGGTATAIAAGLLGASAAAGPAAPIIAGVGLVLAAAASLIGNPKERRDREINSMLNSSIYNEPTSTIYGIDENGYGFDTGRGGGYRSIVVNISAVDAKSFMDRREDISDAVRQAMIDGHGLNRTAREVVLAN